MSELDMIWRLQSLKSEIDSSDYLEMEDIRKALSILIDCALKNK